MDKIIIINDTRIENKLEEFLVANRKHVRLITNMEELSLGGNPVFKEIIDRYEQKNKIRILAGNQVWFFKSSEICRIEANGNTIKIHQKHHISEIKIDINRLWDQLESFSFIRVHPLHIVNFNCIVKLYESYNNTIVLSDGYKIPVSDDYKSSVLHVINKFLGG